MYLKFLSKSESQWLESEVKSENVTLTIGIKA